MPDRTCTRVVHRPAAPKPTKADGTLDVRAWCAQLDAEANRGAATGPGRLGGDR